MASPGLPGVLDDGGAAGVEVLGGAVVGRGVRNDGSGGPLPPGAAVGLPSTVVLQPATSSAAASTSCRLNALVLA
ncbi:hypothetical protein MNVM_14860 [Mycobacterium novum]|uniref:Uncharacterized protein n=1 Tax=Mycobacterium novum TaxID=2492438 RepID=A0A7I7JKG7_9MYCO|nr:hypothetical protein MNVM_14860 [Mycobacterium novum]